MNEFMKKYKIDIDIIGYVRSEYSRIKRQIERGVTNKEYLIAHLSDEDCFYLVEKEIGWFPKIYSYKWIDKRIGEALKKWGHELDPKQRKTIKKYHKQGFNNMSQTYRVFKHNNCLPCKNMHQWELFMVRVFYKDQYDKAIKLAKKLGSHWGREGKEVNELTDCEICSV